MFQSLAPVVSQLPNPRTIKINAFCIDNHDKNKDLGLQRSAGEQWTDQLVRLVYWKSMKLFLYDIKVKVKINSTLWTKLLW